MVGQVAAAIAAAGGVVVVAGIAVLIGAIAAAREARTYDAVILRVLGATRAQLLAGQAIEYALLGDGGDRGRRWRWGWAGLGTWWSRVFAFAWAPDPWAVAGDGRDRAGGDAGDRDARGRGRS